MRIVDTKKENDWVVVILELEIDRAVPFGKMKITPRWKAAANSLRKIIPSDLELLQIDAGQEGRGGRYGQSKIQTFTFYYGKLKDKE